MLYFNKELKNALSLAPYQSYRDCHLWDGAPGICILSFLGASGAITHGLVIGTLYSGQLTRPLVALILQDLRSHLKLQGYHFTPFIFFPLGFSFTRSSWPDFQKKEMVSPSAEGFLERLPVKTFPSFFLGI